MNSNQEGPRGGLFMTETLKFQCYVSLMSEARQGQEECSWPNPDFCRLIPFSLNRHQLHGKLYLVVN